MISLRLRSESDISIITTSINLRYFGHRKGHVATHDETPGLVGCLIYEDQG